MTTEERRAQIYEQLNKVYKKARYSCLSRGEIEAIKNALTVMEIYMAMAAEFKEQLNGKYGKEANNDN